MKLTSEAKQRTQLLGHVQQQLQLHSDRTATGKEEDTATRELTRILS